LLPVSASSVVISKLRVLQSNKHCTYQAYFRTVQCSRHAFAEFDAGFTTSAKYAVSMYFIFTIFTTVGFGDIHAENTTELVVIVIVMLTGVLAFGALLQEVQGLLQSSRLLSMKKKEWLSQARLIMRSRGAPAFVEREVVRFLEFDISEKFVQEKQHEFMTILPDPLRCKIMEACFLRQLEGVSWLRRLQSPYKVECCQKIWMAFELETVMSGTILAGPGQLTSSLHLIVSGTVEVRNGQTRDRVCTRTKGDFLSEWGVLGDWRWYHPMSRSEDVFILTCITPLSMLVLNAEAFQGVLKELPQEVTEEMEAKYQCHVMKLLKARYGVFKRVPAESLQESDIADRWAQMVAQLCKDDESGSPMATNFHDTEIFDSGTITEECLGALECSLHAIDSTSQMHAEDEQPEDIVNEPIVDSHEVIFLKSCILPHQHIPQHLTFIFSSIALWTLVQSPEDSPIVISCNAQEGAQFRVPANGFGISQKPQNINGLHEMKTMGIKELDEIKCMRKEIQEVKEDVSDVKKRMVDMQADMRQLLLAVQKSYPVEVTTSLKETLQVVGHVAGCLSARACEHNTIDDFLPSAWENV
jgi:hypothetical protein